MSNEPKSIGSVFGNSETKSVKAKCCRCGIVAVEIPGYIVDAVLRWNRTLKQDGEETFSRNELISCEPCAPIIYEERARESATRLRKERAIFAEVNRAIESNEAKPIFDDRLRQLPKEFKQDHAKWIEGARKRFAKRKGNSKKVEGSYS